MTDRSLDDIIATNMGAKLHRLRAQLNRVARHAQNCEAQLYEARRDHWEEVGENQRLRAEVDRLTAMVQNSHPHAWCWVRHGPGHSESDTSVLMACHICGRVMRILPEELL